MGFLFEVRHSSWLHTMRESPRDQLEQGQSATTFEPAHTGGVHRLPYGPLPRTTLASVARGHADGRVPAPRDSWQSPKMPAPAEGPSSAHVAAIGAMRGHCPCRAQAGQRCRAGTCQRESARQAIKFQRGAGRVSVQVALCVVKPSPHSSTGCAPPPVTSVPTETSPVGRGSDARRLCCSMGGAAHSTG